MRQVYQGSNNLVRSDQAMPLGTREPGPRNDGWRRKESESSGSCDSETDEDPPTPVNEDLTSDEFDWVRSSPILTNLLAGKELELATELGTPRSSLSVGSNDRRFSVDPERSSADSADEPNVGRMSPSLRIGERFPETSRSVNGRRLRNIMNSGSEADRNATDPCREFVHGRLSPCFPANDRYSEAPRASSAMENVRHRYRMRQSPTLSNRSSLIRDDCSAPGFYEGYMDRYPGSHHPIYFPPPPPLQPPPCHCHHPEMYHPSHQFHGDCRQSNHSPALNHGQIRALEYPYAQCQTYRYNSEFAMKLYASEPSYKRRSFSKVKSKPFSLFLGSGEDMT